MISKDLFIKTMQNAEKFESEVERWSEFGIDVFELPIGTIPWEMFNCWLDSHFDDYGKDWITWYLWERKSIITGEILPCYDENSNEFYVNNLHDLWDLVKNYQLKPCTDSPCKFKYEKCNN